MRLTRGEAQRRTRAKVLAAALDEFTEQGFRAAKIDSIADRAELTRGAVYSNFPSKRALYFAVLADRAENAPPSPAPASARTVRAAVGDLARAWMTGLPLATDEQHSVARLGVDLLPEILADERTRVPYAELMKLEALLLGLALENLAGPGAARRVRVAETVLTALHGAAQMAAAAPGFVEPFDMISAGEHLAGLDLDDAWRPPHLAYVAPAARCDKGWSPPSAVDALRAEPATLTGDHVLTILGLHRLSAAEEAVRAAPPGTAVTVAVVTGERAELAPLARLVIADARALLRAAFARPARPRVQVVVDESGALAASAGVPTVSDATEAAVHIRRGRIIAYADGRGAGHAAASAGN